MAFYTDQLGNTLQIDAVPQRIVSVVPSQTELLYHLQLHRQVCGITKFCVHPQQWFRSKVRVGGTKHLHLNEIEKLQPDLILANKEENTQAEIEWLADRFPVWVSDINNLAEALHMITAVGEITGTTKKANEIVNSITHNFAQLTDANKLTPPKTAYLIWKDPYMTVGANTFINCMLQLAGFRNIFSDQQRYPQVSLSEIKDRGCELLILSSEPYPFQQKQVNELQPHLPDTKIVLADGEMFSWYGSRLIQAPAYFLKLHAEICS